MANELTMADVDRYVALMETVARALMDNALWPGAFCGEFSKDAERNVWRHAARAAIAALQPTLAEAREAGRREGLKQAAQVCEAERLEWVTSGLQGSEALAAAYCRRAIRALIPATETPPHDKPPAT